MKIFAGRANRPLAEKIAEGLGTELGDVEIRQFSDGELFVQFNENVRGVDIFIVQPTFPPAENLLELLIMIDAAARQGPINDITDKELVASRNCVSSIGPRVRRVT
jgi:ribose-phosphate pyrophosphokinase